MPSVLVANPKGGCGKTTLATNLAGHFARRGTGAGPSPMDYGVEGVRAPTLPPRLRWGGRTRPKAEPGGGRRRELLTRSLAAPPPTPAIARTIPRACGTISASHYGNCSITSPTNCGLAGNNCSSRARSPAIATTRSIAPAASASAATPCSIPAFTAMARLSSPSKEA